MISDLSIKRPVFAWMLMVGIIVFGLIGFKNLGISQLPDIDFPVVSISVSLEGAAPEVMESQVTDIIEDAIMAVPGIKEVNSTSKQGQATISVEFELDKDIDIAVQELQTRVYQAQRNLPLGIDPPVISKSNPEDQPIMWIALSGDRSQRQLIEFARDQLKNKFSTVSGIGDVLLGGYVDPNVRLWVNADALKRYELSASDVVNVLKTQHVELPAGRIENNQKEFNVQVKGEASTMSEFQQMVIPNRGGSPLYTRLTLGDIAHIEDGLADVRRISRSEKKLAIGLGIRKQRGTNAVAVSKQVKQRLAEIQKTLPSDLHLKVIFDTTRFIEESSHELIFTLLMAAILTSVVCWIFMGSFSAAFNIILSIPVSIIGSFILMYFFGFTLNTFTLLGLSLVIGIVVDDAIMVLENIVRHRENGEGKVVAAILGSREIAFAALAATVSILAIFIPVVFMKGIIGKFFFQFGVTISVAVSLSLLEALTLAPMRSSQFLQVSHDTRLGKWIDQKMRYLTQGYQAVLQVLLDRKGFVLTFSLVFFVASLFTVKFLKKEFIPPQDQSRFMIRIQTPLGSSMPFTNAVFEKIEDAIMKHPALKTYFAAVGGFGGGDVNAGNLSITMKDMKDRPLSQKTNRPITQKEMMDDLRNIIKKVPGVKRVSIQDLSLTGFSSQRGFPIEFSIRGPDWQKLGELSLLFKEKLNQSGLMTDVDSDYYLGMPEIQILPDREKARLRGVSIQSIAETIQALVGGLRVGKYTKNGKRYDIRMRLSPEQRSVADHIKRLSVRNNRGELVMLGDVVSIIEKPSLLSITRKDRERAINLFANMVGKTSQQEALEKAQLIAKDILPEGYRMVLSGSAKTYKDSFQSLMIALLLGLVVAYMILASQFNSFIHPVTVLLALPFSLSGAFMALLVSQQSLNLYSMIGILLLMGLVKKNSILLVDFTNQKRQEGLPAKQALLSACPVRLRPILMTSIATIAGAIPAAISFGPGAETMIPMGVVIIGGVLVSTVLTLFVVPCAYLAFSKIENKTQTEEVKQAYLSLGEKI